MEGGSLTLNNEPCLASLFLIDLNPNELYHYPFMVSVDRCNKNCIIFDDLLSKYVFRIKEKM